MKNADFKNVDDQVLIDFLHVFIKNRDSGKYYQWEWIEIVKDIKKSIKE